MDFWNVINEFNLGIDNESIVRKYNSVIYHAHGYHLIKQYSKAPVSSAHALIQYYGKRQNDSFDIAMQKYKDVCDNEFFFHAIRTGELVVPFMDGIINKDIKNTCDFWSVNLYTRGIIDARVPDLHGERYSFTKTKMLPKEFYLDEFYGSGTFKRSRKTALYGFDVGRTRTVGFENPLVAFGTVNTYAADI